MVSGRRKFNGKIFTLESSHTFKKDLNRRKANLKVSGAKVRVVPGEKHRRYGGQLSGRKFHHVYIRRKR